MAKCDICGTKVGFLDTRCTDCMEKRNQEIREKRNMPDASEARQEAEQAALDLTVTTAPSLEGQRVVKTIDIVTAECVFGMNVLRDMFAGISDFFGGRNQSSQKVLRDARVTCLNELRREAVAVGGNAVIAVDLDYSEFSGGGKSMLFLVASGTAVVVEPLEAAVE
ncbi:YbjQ family protein [Halomonas elongata]|uniref:YbjQ family protein n=1 Tax=Halomonas elongata TaxID=2746 RepID=UPI0023AF6BB4|nr:YbjQ family protein [Halomonas elongata]